MRELELEEMAELFKILSDTTRLRIIERLTLHCQSVTAIASQTGLSQPLVSHHLRLLKDKGLALAERRGLFTYY
ncbi:MAG: winged helix-turn-helix transcriptional regulator [Armatimonadetes bacterium]|nr:winged helix-turn-helix transcriptional regulator [Armatimonadota bacterium]